MFQMSDRSIVPSRPIDRAEPSVRSRGAVRRGLVGRVDGWMDGWTRVDRAREAGDVDAGRPACHPPHGRRRVVLRAHRATLSRSRLSRGAPPLVGLGKGETATTMEHSGFGGKLTPDGGSGKGARMPESYRSRVDGGEGSRAGKIGSRESPSGVLSPRSWVSSRESDEDDLVQPFSASEARAEEGADARDLTQAFDAEGGESSFENVVDSPRILRAMPPSVDDGGLERRISELRVALRTAEQALDRTHHRFELAEGGRRASEAECTTLRTRIWALEGSQALVEAAQREEDLDALRGRLLNEATVELAYAAKATTEADERARSIEIDCKKLQDTIAALSAASSAESETLSTEIAQARMRIRSDARELASITERLTQVETQSAQANQSKQTNDDTMKLLGDAQKDAERARASLAETMRHNEFLQGRVNELEAIAQSDATAHYDQELRRVREHLGAEISRLKAELKRERSSRKALQSSTKDSAAADGLPDAPECGALESTTHQTTTPEDVAKDEWANALGLGADVDDEPVKTSELLLARDALLEAARLEVLKLGEINRKLVQAKLTAEREAISLFDHESAIERNNEAWAAKVAQLELEALRMNEAMSTLKSRNVALSKDCESRQVELEEIRSELNSTMSSHCEEPLEAQQQGSWIKYLPRRHSSPVRSSPRDNNLACLGSWGSLNGMVDGDDDDVCRMDDNDYDQTQARGLDDEHRMNDHEARKHVLEEKSRRIRDRLNTRSAKPPLSPLKASQDAMERSIREGRLAMEAMRASRTSLLRSSNSNIRYDARESS